MLALMLGRCLALLLTVFGKCLAPVSRDPAIPFTLHEKGTDALVRPVPSLRHVAPRVAELPASEDNIRPTQAGRNPDAAFTGKRRLSNEPLPRLPARIGLSAKEWVIRIKQFPANRKDPLSFSVVPHLPPSRFSFLARSSESETYFPASECWR